MAEDSKRPWQQRAAPIQPGDRVAYSRAFLKSTASHTGDLPQARAVVSALEPLGKDIMLAVIEWNIPDLPKRVNVKNLARSRTDWLSTWSEASRPRYGAGRIQEERSLSIGPAVPRQRCAGQSF